MNYYDPIAAYLGGVVADAEHRFGASAHRNYGAAGIGDRVRAVEQAAFCGAEDIRSCFICLDGIYDT